MTQEEHSHIPNECFEERIQRLAELCDNEYYMSASSFVTNKERSARGRTHILQAIEELEELQRITKCTACIDKIIRQITLQEEGLKEIKSI